MKITSLLFPSVNRLCRISKYSFRSTSCLFAPQKDFYSTPIIYYLIVIMNVYSRFLEILGVNKDASEEEVKKAYYKLVKKCHPDRNPND